jgi:hypothetical protein
MQRIRQTRRALGASRIWTHDHTAVTAAVLREDLMCDVTLEEVTSVEVVDGNVEETLVLRVVEVHGDDVVCAGASEEVRNQSTSLGDPLLVTSLRLEVWEHAGAGVTGRQRAGLQTRSRGRRMAVAAAAVLNGRQAIRGSG